MDSYRNYPHPQVHVFFSDVGTVSLLSLVSWQVAPTHQLQCQIKNREKPAYVRFFLCHLESVFHFFFINPGLSWHLVEEKAQPRSTWWTDIFIHGVASLIKKKNRPALLSLEPVHCWFLNTSFYQMGLQILLLPHRNQEAPPPPHLSPSAGAVSQTRQLMCCRSAHVHLSLLSEQPAFINPLFLALDTGTNVSNSPLLWILVFCLINVSFLFLLWSGIKQFSKQTCSSCHPPPLPPPLPCSYL